MEYRYFGNGKIKTSEIGIGTEFLNTADKKTVSQIVNEAYDNGINFFDMLMTKTKYRDNFGSEFRNKRDRIIISGHIFVNDKNDEKHFNDMLKRFYTDYLDITLLQYVDTQKNYDKLFEIDGIYEYSTKLKSSGKTRLVGLCTHKLPIAEIAVKSGCFDLILFPINIAWDQTPGRKELFDLCASKGIDIIAMKPFGRGKLLHSESRINITPIQCLSYVLSVTAVKCVIPGVSSIDELRQILYYQNASDVDKDFSKILSHIQNDIKGACLACNHCLPCPAKINIGRVIRMYEEKLINKETNSPFGNSTKTNFYASRFFNTLPEYKGHNRKPESCIQCGKCEERCPFDVKIIDYMKKIAMSKLKI